MVGGIDSLSSSGSRVWEKSVRDINDIDELFANARDVGYTRVNQYRTTVVGKLARNDTVDSYKIQVQSNSKLSLSIRSIATDEKTSSSSIKEGHEDEEDNLLKLTASGLKIEVYTVKKNGKAVLMGDSSASDGSKNRENLNQLLTGDYKATKGDYYIKISRDKSISQNEEITYSMQLQQGKKPKHDYIVSEAVSEDTQNKKTSKIPSMSALGTLSGGNAYQVLATMNQNATDMLNTAQINMQNITNANNAKK